MGAPFHFDALIKLGKPGLTPDKDKRLIIGCFVALFRLHSLKYEKYFCFAHTQNLRKTVQFQVRSSFVGTKVLLSQRRGTQIYCRISSDEASGGGTFALQNHFVLTECKSIVIKRFFQKQVWLVSYRRP